MHIIVGASFRFTPTVLVYTEEKFDLGYAVDGTRPEHIYTLGLRVGFSTKKFVDSLLASRSE
jgi:hypothetical protein